MEIYDFAYKRHLACLASLPSFKPAADPTKLTAIQLIDKLGQIEDHVCTIYVCNDKPADAKSKDRVTGLDLSLSSDLALYSCIVKAPTAQTNRDADQNYPEAYASQRGGIYKAGIRVLYVPSDDRYVISTGAPFDPADTYTKYFYREIW